MRTASRDLRVSVDDAEGTFVDGVDECDEKMT